MKPSVLPVPLLAAACLLGCGPKVRTDNHLLGERIRPGTRIRCVADFACLRWHEQGLVLSTMDSWRLGGEYLDAVVRRLREKGYAAENVGVADVSWMFHDGAGVPVVRRSGFWFGRKYDLGPKEDPQRSQAGTQGKDGKKADKDEDEEPAVQVFASQGKPCVEFEPGGRGRDEAVPVEPEKAPGSQRFHAFVRQAVRAAAPLVLAPKDLRKQEEADRWTEHVRAQRVAPPARLREHCAEPDLLLLLWGSAVAVAHREEPLALFGGLIGGPRPPQEPPLSGEPGRLAQPRVLDRSLAPYVPTRHVDAPRNLVELRGALLDPATGQVLWFTAHQQAQGTERDSECIFLPAGRRSFARRLLLGFPRARHLGTEKSYYKMLSSFRPHEPPG